MNKKILWTASLLVLVHCKGKSTASGDAGASATKPGETKTAESGGFHCLRNGGSRCEESSDAMIEKSRAEAEKSSDELARKMAGLVTRANFEAFCKAKDTFAEGACPAENRVGSCVSTGGKNIYYGGASGFTAENFAFECKEKDTLEDATGKAMAKPAAKRMSCFRPKKNECIEDDFKGKLSQDHFCDETKWDGPGTFAMTPCPSAKHAGACQDAPVDLGGGKTLATARVRHFYDAKGAAKGKSMCKIMKGTWTK